MQKLIGKMARMYPLLIGMGFTIVTIALIVGYFNSQLAAEYFSQPKSFRETSLLTERASIESTGLWLPYFKFLGLGLILGGIVMALRVIIDRLKVVGTEVLSNLPIAQRPDLPSPPRYARLMPLVMMAGVLVFVVALLVGLDLASTARQLFSNPIAEIDAAAAGSTLLAQLESIRATSAWLIPFKFFGIATEFLAILIGLATIVYILTNQTRLLAAGIRVSRQAARKTVRDTEQVSA